MGVQTPLGDGTASRGRGCRSAANFEASFRDRTQAVNAEGGMPGSDAAWCEFVGQCRPYIYHIALSVLRDADDAEDVTQEALLRVFRFLSRFEHRASFSTWLYRITYNACLSYLAEKRRDQRHQSATETAELTDPRRDFDGCEFWVALESAVDTLPLLYRETARLYYLEERSYREIAQRTTLPESTVKIRLYRARVVLREALKVA